MTKYRLKSECLGSFEETRNSCVSSFSSDMNARTVVYSVGLSSEKYVKKYKHRAYQCVTNRPKPIKTSPVVIFYFLLPQWRLYLSCMFVGFGQKYSHGLHAFSLIKFGRKRTAEANEWPFRARCVRFSSFSIEED